MPTLHIARNGRARTLACQTFAQCMTDGQHFADQGYAVSIVETGEEIRKTVLDGSTKARLDRSSPGKMKPIRGKVRCKKRVPHRSAVLESRKDGSQRIHYRNREYLVVATAS